MADYKRDKEVSALLHAPLGTLIVIRCIEELNENRPWAFTAEHFSEFVIDERDDLRFFTLSAERLMELVVKCAKDFSIYAPDYQQCVNALLTRAPLLRSATEQLLDAPGTANWFADLDRKQQVWVSSDGHPPTHSSFHPDLQPFGDGVTKPKRALWTSTSIGTYPSSWIPYLREGENHRPPPYHPWRLEISSTARVYEVHEPQSWYALCLAYPFYEPDNHVMPHRGPLQSLFKGPKRLYEPDNYVMPNWEKVVHTWDGIHLSVGGLLTTEQVYWGTPQRLTQLSGWSIESTVWLQWAFTQIEQLPDTD